MLTLYNLNVWLCEMLINIVFVFSNIIFFLNGLLPFRSKNEQYFNDTSKAATFSTKKFDQTVIMIVDALRTDFVNSKLMPLTTKLIEGHGCLINVSVSSPTVTLPRIKSLITGSVPQFMDVLHNLGSPQLLEDSLLHRARKRNKHILFYGDDTWLKIFSKDIFLRNKGTTSFFVNDFHEVDDNVTQYLKLELPKNDWDIMILHYLGLDHIGHVHGPFSSLIQPKLHEMDVILSGIFESISQKNLTPLVILTGDHGMRDTGGHGGSTYSETHVPFGVLGIACDNGLMDQVDITPNLSALLGLDVPKTNIGKITKLLLKTLKMEEYLSVLYYNAQFLSQKHGKSESEFISLSNIYNMYLENKDVKIASRLTSSLTEYSEKVSRLLIEASTQQDLMAMVVSVIFLCYFLISHLNGKELFELPFYNFMFHVFLLILRWFHKDQLVLITILFASICQLLRFLKLNIKSSSFSMSFLVLFQPVTWLSSSFIEEEHEFWYYVLNTFLLAQAFVKLRQNDFKSAAQWCFLIVSFRFAESLNQMGDKWASLPDTSDFLNKPENCHLRFLLLFFSILSTYFCLKLKKSVFNLEKMILFIILIYKIVIPYQIVLARVIYALLLFYFIISSDFLNFWIFLISFLSKSSNLCLIPLTVFTSGQIYEDFESDVFTISLHLILLKSLHFMQGNGNTIASIDVAVGYTALTSYNPVLVGAQLLIYSYSTTILIHLLLFKSVKNKKMLNLLYTERLFTTIVIFLVSILFRNHIFIWTVYAPKLCIECCHTITFFVEFLLYVFVFSFLRGK